MGYSNTNIVHWGVELTPNEAESLHKYLISNNLLKTQLDNFSGNEIVLDDIKMDESDLTEYPCVPNLPSHINGIEQPIYHRIPRYRCSRFVHEIECRSEGSDSRIESNHFDYDEGYTHYFGVYCGSKGYAYMDEVKSIMNDIPTKAKDNFIKYCEPILRDLNIEKSPDVQFFSQVW